MKTEYFIKRVSKDFKETGRWDGYYNLFCPYKNWVDDYRIENFKCDICRGAAKRCGVFDIKENKCPEWPNIEPPKGNYFQLWVFKNSEYFILTPPFIQLNLLAEYIFNHKHLFNGYSQVQILDKLIDLCKKSEEINVLDSDEKIEKGRKDKIFYLRNHENKPVVTIYQIFINCKLKAQGISFCSESDNPSKKIGVEIAKSRAEKALRWRMSTLLIRRSNILHDWRYKINEKFISGVIYKSAYIINSKRKDK